MSTPSSDKPSGKTSAPRTFFRWLLGAFLVFAGNFPSDLVTHRVPGAGTEIPCHYPSIWWSFCPALSRLRWVAL